MRLTRRAWLAQQAAAAVGTPALAATLASCALSPGDESDRIVDARTGARLLPDQVLQEMLPADVVMLGELHDNPLHHARRAELLEALRVATAAAAAEAVQAAHRAARGQVVTVVAEHLPRGALPRLQGSPVGDALRQALEESGFEARAWGWPLHEPLFAAVARAGHRLQGGNLERAAVRRVAREGAGAVPAELRPLLAAASLDPAAQAALESDLLRGHCGHLGSDRMPGMVWAQRARDAAMAATVLAALDAARAAGVEGPPVPVLLLAGNGHVRRDYGVPQLLQRRRSDLRLLTVGFLEPGTADLKALPFDIAWFTRAAERDDPCKVFTVPRPAPLRST